MTSSKEEIEHIVERACVADTNIFGYEIWTHHITTVAENGRWLAPLFDADPEVVEIAALLHDYASIKDESLYENHHEHGPVEAEKVLKRFDYSEDEIGAIKHCIATHRASAGENPNTPEAECLANADAMAHIQQIPSLLKLAYVEHEMDIDEGATWVREKIERSWHKLHPETQSFVEDEYKSAMNMLSATADAR